jgi:hypothetical protein
MADPIPNTDPVVYPMSEEETYARMLLAYRALCGDLRTKKILRKAMDAMAEEFHDRTDGELELAAEKLIRAGEITP